MPETYIRQQFKKIIEMFKPKKKLLTGKRNKFIKNIIFINKRTYLFIIISLVSIILLAADLLFVQPFEKKEDKLLQEKDKLLQMAVNRTSSDATGTVKYGLTDSVVKIKEIFNAYGIVVKDISVSSATTNSNGENIKYSKTSLKLQGSWSNVVKSLEDMVIQWKMPVIIQEIDLGQEDSQVSLKIFYEKN